MDFIDKQDEVRRNGRPRGYILDASKVRRRRRAMALTQGELAELCHLALRTVAAAEAGRPVSASTARAIATQLKVGLFDLIDIRWEGMDY